MGIQAEDAAGLPRTTSRSTSILTETDIRLASQRLIAAYGTEAWFIAADLAVAAARAGNANAADMCNRIAQAIEQLGTTRARLQ